MKKKYFYAAAMAAMLASCSSDDLSLSSKSVKTEAPGVEGAVNFSAYTPRSITRAGYAGVMTTEQLQKTKEQGGGFGVFGYYTDQQDYDLQISKPNFMYNQGVFYDDSKWGYEPVKYWPNEYGADAESQDIDKVSFFAYAPYVDVNPTTGKVTGDAASGITAVSRNTNTGDPIVWYKGSFKPSEAVDLCWGVVGSAADADWAIIQDNGIQRMDVGQPWLNVQRPKGVTYDEQKLKFTFKHALAQLNIQIDADPDLTAHNEADAVATDTKVYVRSITINGLASKGSLNLNNIVANEPLWQSYYGSGSIYSETATISDGRRDGKEGVAGATAVNETLTGLNPQIISDDGNTTTGVTHELQNLFDAAELTDAIYTIPTGEPITVSIVYDVETKDSLLANVISDGVTRGSSIENKITKEVVFGEDEFLKAGKKYTLLLHLGLNSVKFDAAVSEWEDNSAAGETWLPSNVAKGVSIQSAGAVITRGHVLPTGLDLTAEIQPEDVVNKDIQWSLSGENAANVALSATTGSSTKVTPVAGFVGPVTLNAYNPGTGKTASVQLYCTKAASTMTAADNGRVVATDAMIYKTVTDARDYALVPNTKAVAMIGDGASKICYSVSDWGPNTWNVLDTFTDPASHQEDLFIPSAGEVAGGTWSIPTAEDMQMMFRAVGQNGWTNITRTQSEAEYVDQTFSGEVNKKIFAWNSFGLDDSELVDVTSAYLDKGGYFNGKLDTNGMVWGDSPASCAHNILVSYGKFRQALVACGAQNMKNQYYWLSDPEYNGTQGWYFAPQYSLFFVMNKNSRCIYRLVLKFN